MNQFPIYKTHPFIRLLLPVIVGILLSSWATPNIQFSLILLSISVILLGLGLFFAREYKTSHVNGISVFLFLLTTGICLHTFQNKRSESKVENSNIFIAEIVEIPTEKNNSFKSEVNLVAVKTKDYWLEQKGKIIIYFEKDSIVPTLVSGQNIAFSAELGGLPKSMNQIGFDYAKYLSLKGINNTVYLSNDKWQPIEIKRTRIVAVALNLRMKLIQKFKSLNLSQDELGVLSALTVGYKDFLGTEIRSAYSGAGAMHVLAVSGLHVGIVYLILNFLLGFVTKIFRYKALKYSILILLLWFYAFLTGLSPSVTRATVMFTFILVGKVLDKRINIYNSLAASAFFLLIINPNFLFSIGFQLSYIAVVGIVYFQPKIYKLFYLRNYILDKIWALTSVSLAAQIATAPISILYFNQFPVYFWLSNILVILAATALIYLTILFLLFGFSNFITEIIHWCIENILVFNNQFIYWINKLPGAVISNISMVPLQVILLYGILVLLAIWINTVSKKAFFSMLVLTLSFSCSVYVKFISEQDQNFLNVFHLKRATAIQFVDGNTSYWISQSTNDSLQYDRIKKDANIFWNAKACSEYGISDTIYSRTLLLKKGFWHFKDKKGLILHSDSKIPVINEQIVLDYLIITGSPKFKLSDLKNISFHQIIIDSSVPIWIRNNWKNELYAEKIHFTQNKGAFIQKIQL